MVKIPYNILDKVNALLVQYHMNTKKQIYVAYSGGKDSFLTCIILHELGFEVMPIILDIGYNAYWDEGICHLKQYGIKAYVVSMDYLKSIASENEINAIENFYASVKKNVKLGLTACTPCFNSKIIMLECLSNKFGIHEIAFGHHGTDAVTSLLKSYLMYQDRYEKGHVYFSLSSFENIISECKERLTVRMDEFLHSQLCPTINRLIKAGIIGTDEPIRQKYISFDIIRPLFNIFESEIESTLKSADIEFPNAECFRMHIRNSNVMTPRELIQNKIVNGEGTNHEIMQYILGLIKNELDEDGTLKYNARKRRTELLGEKYELHLQSCAKL